jgi:cation transport ATPase
MHLPDAPEMRQPGPRQAARSAAWRWNRRPSRRDRPQSGTADMTRRFWIGLVLTLPVFALEMGGHLTGMDHLIGADVELDPAAAGDARGAVGRLAVLPARLAAPCVNRSLNMFTLIALGTGVAWLLQRGGPSPRRCSRRLPRADGSVAVYFEAAAVIVVLVLLGQVLELRARERTGAIRRCSTSRRHGAPARRRRRRAGVALEQVRSATGCACGPATRCRSTARCSRGAPCR